MGQEQETLDLCCGSRKCPVVREVPGGFRVEDGDQTVTLTREQAQKVADWLAERLKST